MKSRGSYAKGVAKREEILTTALEVIAREGLGRTSIRELADAAGLSQAGLLHYFDSKEELYTAILRKRDEIDADIGADPARAGIGDEDDQPIDVRAGFLGVIRHNADVPGLVDLYARLSVDAADPAHPAHDYFVERGEGLRAYAATAIAAQQAAGLIDDRVDPATIARLIQAVADGMQVQWMLEPDIDMAATVDALFELLAVPVHARGASS